MKAEDSQIPGNGSQKPSLKPPDNNLAQLYAICRRLQNRVESLERTQSITRRDVLRIDKSQYRAKELLPSYQDNNREMKAEKAFFPGTNILIA